MKWKLPSCPFCKEKFFPLISSLMLLVPLLKFILSHWEPMSYYSQDSETMGSILISRLRCSKEGKQLPHLSLEFPTVSETYIRVVICFPQLNFLAKFLMANHVSARSVQCLLGANLVFWMSLILLCRIQFIFNPWNKFWLAQLIMRHTCWGD